MSSIADIQKDENKRGPGRPSVNSTGIMVKLLPADLTEIDNWRRNEADLPTRPEAIRRLIKRGLTAQNT